MDAITRGQAIDKLRAKMLALVDDEHCMCAVASRLQIGCGGFSQWTFTELKERYDWIVKRRPHITRAELEELANRWQLARQFVQDTLLSCDTQTHEHHHRICEGWEGFSDEDLARFHRELSGEEVEVLPDAPEEADVRDLEPPEA